MAQRTTCLCDGKIIGIESIFTVIDGKQINIPDKVEALRIRSRNKELFCPCGCGANLTLVAGDRNLREQHFRLRDGSVDSKCIYTEEGLVSINSKIVLKCWLEDKCPDSSIETRVPLNMVEDIERRYEISILAKESGIGISYSHKRENLNDEKLDLLEQNAAEIKLHYVTDIRNSDSNEQYPELMMKIQKRQGYCLFLNLDGEYNDSPDYYGAHLSVHVFLKNERGTWQEISVLEDMLSKFDFDLDGALYHLGCPISVLVNDCIEKFKACIRKRKEELERKRQEEEAERIRRQELWKRQQEEAQKRAEEQSAKLRHEEELRKQERQRKIEESTPEEIEKRIDLDQETPFKDAFGNRWVRCAYCGKVALDSKFSSYGGVHTANLGRCYECNGKEPLEKYVVILKPVKQKPKESEAEKCPICGAKLVKRVGKFGTFCGCSRFPECRYTKSRW